MAGNGPNVCARFFNFAGLIRTLLIVSLMLGCRTVNAQQRAFDFALIGDMPYTKVQEREYQRVLEALNSADLAPVVHIGDFQFDARPYNANPSIASMPCVDENYKAILASFQSVRHPFVLTPGDNDWSDCAPLQAQKADPLELLQKLRTMFYPEGKSLGQRTIEVRNQSSDPQFSKFRENLRWVQAASFLSRCTLLATMTMPDVARILTQSRRNGWLPISTG